MKADTLDTFARCRAASLAAMIAAGGQPCWVAAPAPAAAALAPAAAAGHTGAAEAAPSAFTPRELSRLEGQPPRLLDALASVLSHLGEYSPPPTLVAGRRR